MRDLLMLMMLSTLLASASDFSVKASWKRAAYVELGVRITLAEMAARFVTFDT